MNKYLRRFTYIIIIFALVTLLDFSNNAGQNIIMLCVMGVCPIILFFKIWRIEANDFLIFTVLLILLFSYYIHPEQFRLSTVLYSGMFIIQFVTYKALAKQYINIYSFRKLLVVLLYLFFVVLVIQQISRLAHLPEFNSWHYKEFKMNSLAQEPSALPPTIIIMFYSIVKVDEILLGRGVTFKEHFKKCRRLWILFFYMIFTCGSTTGIFILPIFLLYFWRKDVIKKLPTIAISLVALVYVFSLISPFVTERMIAIVNALASLDPMKIYEADSSASARLAPYLIYFNDIDLFSLDFWLGHGVDYGISHMSLFLLGYVDEERVSGIGGLVNFAYDYGFIAFILFLIYLRKNIFRFKSFDFILWLFVFTVQGFNISLFWAPIILMYTTKLLALKSKNQYFNNKINFTRLETTESDENYRLRIS